ncbi:chitinase family protein [Actinidia rufa]|uniref:Chitinase family protein n=1 Tax=Actinidia rufa TaxID=165716 RepID=A0A7J0E645_9ERIC|nr:chitinase family protein [Actinidia rufa]
MVVNATIAAMAKHGMEGRSGINVYHATAGVQNPLSIGDFFKFSREYFLCTPFVDSKGKRVSVEEMKYFSDMDEFSKYIWGEIALKCGTVGATSNFDKKAEMKCKRTVKQLMRLTKLYEPYMFNTGWFHNDNIQKLMDEMSEEEEEDFGIDFGSINWRNYITQVHIPGMKKHVLKGCSSCQYGAPAPNRVGNGVRTRPHAPFEDRRVRSVSATRPRRSHALPRVRGRTHAPARAKEELPRARKVAHTPATRRDDSSRARTRGSRARGAAGTRAMRGKEVHAPGGCQLLVSEVPDSDSLALSEVSRYSGFIRGDLHDPLENKGEKPVAKKDEEWRKINRKTIGLIRQCIGHEVFHHVAQETSAYELWIKLEEMYQAKTSRNKALLMRRLVNLKLQRETTVAEHTSEFQSLVNQLTSVDLQFDDEMQALLLLSSLPESWETLVVSFSNAAPNGKLTTSMVMDALFNEEARRREMGSTDQSESQALVLEGSRERGRCQGRSHHRGTGKGRWRSQARDTAATTVMADDDEIDVLLAASEDGKSDWIQRDAVLTLVEELSEFPRETRRCCGERRLEGYTDWRGVSRQEELLSNMGPVVLARRMDKGSNCCIKVRKASKRRGTWRVRSGTRAQGDALGYVLKSFQTRVMQPVQDVHREAQKKETKSILRSCTAKGAAMPNRVSFALDLISGGVLSSCAQKGGRYGAKTTRKMTYFAAHPGGGSYGGAGSEAVRKDNLKTSDYPLVGWRGRLLNPAYLDESKPTWMSPSPVAKPKLDWSYMECPCDGKTLDFEHNRNFSTRRYKSSGRSGGRALKGFCLAQVRTSCGPASSADSDSQQVEVHKMRDDAVHAINIVLAANLIGAKARGPLRPSVVLGGLPVSDKNVVS